MSLGVAHFVPGRKEEIDRITTGKFFHNVMDLDLLLTMEHLIWEIYSHVVFPII
jgi:hypothetical protein